MEVKISNGYQLHALDIFVNAYVSLMNEVEALEKKDPEGFFNHPKVKLFEAVHFNVFENVPNNPNHPQFRLGHTLGKNFTSWRRVKKQTLPDRYRLFFRFQTVEPKVVVYAWLNDESTYRKEGARTDCYAVFEKMLKKGVVPNSMGELLEVAKTMDEFPEETKTLP